MKGALAADISSRVCREPSFRGRRAWEKFLPHTLSHLSRSVQNSDNTTPISDTSDFNILKLRLRDSVNGIPVAESLKVIREHLTPRP